MARKLKFQQFSALLVSLMLGLAHPEDHIHSCSIKNLFGFKAFQVVGDLLVNGSFC